MPSFSRDKRINRRLGDEHRNKAEWALAAEAYRRHLAERPADAAIWVQLGHVEKEAGRFDEAEAAYEAAAALAPADPDPLLHLSHMLKQQGHYDRAFDAFLRLYRIAPDANTLDELHGVRRRRPEPAAIVAASGAILFAMQDFVDAVAAHGTMSGVQRVQAGVALAAMADPTVDAHFIVYGDDEDGRPCFLRLRDAAVRDIIDHASGHGVDHPTVLHRLTIARLGAAPIRFGAGSTMVISAAFRGVSDDARHYLHAKRHGARLVAYMLDDLAAIHADAHDADPGAAFWRALADLLYVADFLLTGSDNLRAELTRLIGEHGGRTVPIETFTAPAGREAGADLLGKLVAMSAASPAVTPVSPVRLQEGAIFRPGDMIGGHKPTGEYYASPMGLALALAFYEADSDGAWMRGGSGELTFQTAAADRDVVIFLALKPAPWAVGGTVSLDLVGSGGGARRWVRLHQGRNLLRLEGPVNSDGGCTILLECDREPKPQPDGTRRYAIGLTAIGYAIAASRATRTELRETFLFT